jgi:hypothetical protein
MRKPSPATVIALVALFVALGGVGVAATGGNFILGQANSANRTTGLTVNTLPTACPAPCQALQVTDNSSALNAGGLGVLGKSASIPAATIQNAGGTSALSLLVNPGKPPLTVNSAARVAKLNADKLDGIDSTGFVQGRGTLLATRMVFAGASKQLLAIPGLGYLLAGCNTNGDASINYVNDSGSTVDLWYDYLNSHFTGIAVPSGSPSHSIVYTGQAISGGTLALGVGSDPGARRTALLHAFGRRAGTGMPCSFQVQGTLWTSQ